MLVKPISAISLRTVSSLVTYPCSLRIAVIFPAPNIVVAIVIGGASGLTATGTNQIIKQLGKKDDADGTGK